MKLGTFWVALLAFSLAIGVSTGCEKPPEEKLIKGIETGDADLVRQAIKENVQLSKANDGDGHSYDQLIKAKGASEIGKLVNDYRLQNTLALGSANNFKEAEAIRDRGLVAEPWTHTAVLYAAIKKGNVDVVNFLLEHCCFDMCLNKSFEGMTPLELAIQSENADMVKCLREHGAKK